MKRVRLVFISLNVIVANAFSFTYTVTNTYNGGPGSLVLAINNANQTSSIDTIKFNIPGPGPYIIQPFTLYPQIVNPVYIDGFSQPNNNDSVYSVIIDGASYGQLDKLFDIQSSNCEIRGLKFQYFPLTGFVAIDLNYWGSSISSIGNVRIKKNNFENNNGAISIIVNGQGGFFWQCSDIVIDSNLFSNNESSIGIGSNCSSNWAPLYDVVLNDIMVRDNKIEYGIFGINIGGGGSDSARSLFSSIIVSNNLINYVTNPIVFNLMGVSDAITDANSIIIKNNIINNAGGSGINYLAGSTGGTIYNVSNISINNNQIYNTASYAIRIHLGGTGGCIVNGSNFEINNNVIDSAQIGLQLDIGGTGSAMFFADSVEIKKNEVSNTYSGIKIFTHGTGGSTAIIEHCLIDSNRIQISKFDGLDIWNEMIGNSIGYIRDIYVSNNEISESERFGILLYNYDPCLVNFTRLDSVFLNYNLIYNNGLHGIYFINDGGCGIQTSNVKYNKYSQNTIYNNGGLGIKISDYSDTLTFNGFEYPIPIIDIVVNQGSNYDVEAHISGEPLTTYTLEFFSNTSPDSSGYGEGQFYLGDILLNTDTNGYGTTNFLTGVNLSGQCVSATASDHNHYNTSEFGNCYSIPLSVMEFLNYTQSILISPNPATDFITVNYFTPLAGDASLILTNITGEKIKTFSISKGKQTTELNIEDVPAGVYFLNLRVENKNVATEKVVVMK